MSHFRSTISSSLLLLLLCACTTESTVQSIPDRAQLEAEVKEMFTYSEELFRNKDLDGLVDRFTSTGTLKLPNAPIFSGRDEIRANYERTLQLDDFQLDLSVFHVDIADAGDMAYAQAEFAVSFNTPAGPFSDKGITLMVLERQNDSWKIASENLSSGMQEVRADEPAL